MKQVALGLDGLDTAESASDVRQMPKQARRGTFTDNMRLPVHGWYRYSAGYSGEWATSEITRRAGSSSLLLDPFAGSGTTLIAAQQAGVPSIGLETHPFVHRIGQAKLKWHLDSALFFEEARRLHSLASHNVASEVEHPSPLLDKCFSRQTLLRLEALRRAYRQEFSNGPFSELLWLAITAIIRATSHAGTAQWQYVLPTKKKANPKDPFAAFLEVSQRYAEDMKFAQANFIGSSALLLSEDARSENIGDFKADIVITSPPYPNNYDYADATRLEMTFWQEIAGWADLQSAVRRHLIRSCSQHSAAERLTLEELFARDEVSPIKDELVAVCEELAEVRLTKGGKKTYHTMIAAYFLDMARVWRMLRKHTVSRPEICFVIGDSAPYGVYVPVDRWFSELALAAGFSTVSFEKIRDRNIKWKNRKHRVPLKEGFLWVS